MVVALLILSGATGTTGGLGVTGYVGASGPSSGMYTATSTINVDECGGGSCLSTPEGMTIAPLPRTGNAVLTSSGPSYMMRVRSGGNGLVSLGFVVTDTNVVSAVWLEGTNNPRGNNVLALDGFSRSDGGNGQALLQ